MSESNVTPLHPGVELPAHLEVRSRRRGAQRASACHVPCEAWPFGEMTAEQIAQVMRVHVTTARRWRRARSLPAPERMLAHVRMSGDLGILDLSWSGWTLRDGELCSPSNVRPFTVSELDFLPFTAQRVASLEATIRRLEAERTKHGSKSPPSECEKFKAIGRVELLARVVAAMAVEFEQSNHESVSTLQEEALAILGPVATLLRKLYAQVDPDSPSPYFKGDGPAAAAFS